MDLKIIPKDLLPAFLQQVPNNLEFAFDSLKDAEISTDSFSFYASVSSVYSSKIEGENIELDSYVKHKKFGIEFLPDYTKKTDDLYNAYSFAKNNLLNKKNIVEVHKLITKNILPVSKQGELRSQNMYVTNSEGSIEYVAASPVELKPAMENFYADVNTLIKKNLSVGEVFFYSALLHLVFVKVHPWNDGNGRNARLIEKWFVAQKLGENAWFIESEKYYYTELINYYKNIRGLGIEYQNLDYSKALPFLLMMAKSVTK